MILPTPVNEVIPLYSFDEWRNRGYVVLKGEKSTGRTPNGLPGFSESQVKRGATRGLRIDTIGQPSRTLQMDNQGNTYHEEPENYTELMVDVPLRQPQYYVPPERTRPVPIENYRDEQVRSPRESDEEAIARWLRDSVNIQNINPASKNVGIRGVSALGADFIQAERQANNAIVNTDIEDAAMMTYFNQMLADTYVNNKEQKKPKKSTTPSPPPHEEQVLSNKRKIDI